MNLRTILPRLSMIAALDTKGKVWFSLQHSTTDSDIIAVFFQHLVQTLNEEEPGW